MLCPVDTEVDLGSWDLIFLLYQEISYASVDTAYAFLFIFPRRLWLMIPSESLAHMRLEFLYPGLRHTMGVMKL
jgi:hypothetical protein